jgi:hypothetical protein
LHKSNLGRFRALREEKFERRSWISILTVREKDFSASHRPPSAILYDDRMDGTLAIFPTEGMEHFNPQLQQATILCCNCGVAIPPNPAVPSPRWTTNLGDVYGLHKDDDRHHARHPSRRSSSLLSRLRGTIFEVILTSAISTTPQRMGNCPTRKSRTLSVMSQETPRLE